MARCGCSTACSCSVVAGDNIEVTGTGSPANPYVISGEPSFVEVADSPSIDFTIAGAGTQASPYQISGSVLINPDADNCLTETPTGLKIACPDGSETIVQGDGITAAVTGSGTLADPYVVSAAGGGALEPQAGCGISVISDPGGPIISADVGGTVWPHACPESNGAPVYCDAATGRLHCDPEKFSIAEYALITSAAGANQFSAFGSNVNHDFGPTGQIVVANPSPCYPMKLVIRTGVRHALFGFNPGGGYGSITLASHLVVSGAIVDNQSDLGHQQAEFERINGAQSVFDSMGAGDFRVYTLPAGGTATFQFTGEVAVLQDTGDNTITNWQTELAIWGVSI